MLGQSQNVQKLMAPAFCSQSRNLSPHSQVLGQDSVFHHSGPGPRSALLTQEGFWSSWSSVPRCVCGETSKYQVSAPKQGQESLSSFSRQPMPTETCPVVAVNPENIFLPFLPCFHRFLEQGLAELAHPTKRLRQGFLPQEFRAVDFTLADLVLLLL